MTTHTPNDNVSPVASHHRRTQYMKVEVSIENYGGRSSSRSCFKNRWNIPITQGILTILQRQRFWEPICHCRLNSQPAWQGHCDNGKKRAYDHPWLASTTWIRTVPYTEFSGHLPCGLLPASCCSAPRPVLFLVLKLSRNVKLILTTSHIMSLEHTSKISVKTAIMQDLAKAVFSYTAYPSSQQIALVAEVTMP